jgi:hypothetical protein
MRVLRANYLFAASRLARVRVILFTAALRTIFAAETDLFGWTGAFIIRRTAFTRSGLSPRISPSSSGVGTGLPMTCTAIPQLYSL